MSVGPTSELSAFNQFVERHLADNLHRMTIEDGIAEFRAYQSDLESLQAKLKIADEQSMRGESRELNDESFWKKMSKRLDAEGIHE